MAELKEYIAKTDENGSVTISEEVVASIAAIAAMELDGVDSLGTSTVTDFLSKKSQSKGVKITFAEDSAEIAITANIKKGYVIPTVAKAVQENVISAVESMTGLKVSAVNVKIGGIAFDKEVKKKNAVSEETAQQ